MFTVAEIEDQIQRLMGGGEERRASERLDQDRPVSLCLARTDGAANDTRADSIPARLYDLSSDGICVVVDRPLEPGVRFAVRPVSPQSTAQPIDYIVVRCHPAPGGRYFVGAGRDSTSAPDQPASDPVAVLASPTQYPPLRLARTV